MIGCAYQCNMSAAFFVPPSMADIARAANVHQTTVSRALRNDPRLRASTRARLTELARDMGYRPNPMVSALVSLRRSRHPPRNPTALAFVSLWGANAADSFTGSAHLAGAKFAAGQQGYNVNQFRLQSSGMTEERLNKILVARNTPGAIIAALPQAHGHFQLDWGRLCTVVIEYSFTTPALDRVVHDSYGGMVRILGECRRRGIHRVGLMLTHTGHQRTERLNGAAYWIEQKSDSFFPAIPPLILTGWDPRQFAKWKQYHRPEVVVTSQVLLPDLEAWCLKHGVRIGHDLYVINVNAKPADQVSGINQEPFSIGAIAAQMVIDKINRNDRGIPARRNTVLTPGLWLEGRTLLPLPAIAASLRPTLLAKAL
jgi:DNA-binding LacI/PurR family transcriptional regulator